MDSKGSINEFVHEYYSKAGYAKAYAPIVNPIPGQANWDRTQHPQPN